MYMINSLSLVLFVILRLRTANLSLSSPVLVYLTQSE